MVRCIESRFPGVFLWQRLALEIAHAASEVINKIVVSGLSLINTEINKMVQITVFCSVVDYQMYRQMQDLLNKGLRFWIPKKMEFLELLQI